MATAALRMAFSARHTTATSAAGVATAQWTPTRAACHPANLRFAYATLDPIAADLLHDDDLEIREAYIF